MKKYILPAVIAFLGVLVYAQAQTLPVFRIPQGGTGTSSTPSIGDILVATSGTAYAPTKNIRVNNLTATSATIGTLTIPTLVLDPLTIGTSTVFYGNSGTHSYISNGSLSVGTSTDCGLFCVASSSGYALTIGDNNTITIGTLNGILKGTSGAVGTATASTDYQLPYWILSGSNLYASTTSWNVGIGLTSPSYKLDVAGSLRVSSSTVLATNTGTVSVGTSTVKTTLYVYGSSTFSNGEMRIGDGVTNYMSFANDGTQIASGTPAWNHEMQLFQGSEGLCRTPTTAGATMTSLGDNNGEYGVAQFADAATSSVDCFFKVPENYIASTTIPFAVDNIVATTTGNGLWGIAWAKTSEGSATSTLSAYTTSTFPAAATINARSSFALSVINGNTIQAGDWLMLRMTRFAADVADTWNGFDAYIPKIYAIFRVDS